MDAEMRQQVEVQKAFFRQYPERRSCRDKRDAVLMPEIKRVYKENYSVDGVRKVWRQLKREGVSVARCEERQLSG